jgi:hypothetical protein
MDVAQAVLNATRNGDTASKVYELAGPRVRSLDPGFCGEGGGVLSGSSPGVHTR